MTELFDYLIRISPGFLMAIILLFLLKRKSPLLHLMIFIFLFIFTRDAMTPLNLWSFGTEGFFWLRFTNNWIVILTSGFSSLVIIYLMNIVSPELKSVIVWQKNNKMVGVLIGITSAIIVTLPLIIIQINIPIELRGGVVSRSQIPLLLFLALTGNFYEEVLFRGFLQGWLEAKLMISKYKSAILSGFFFGFGHLFLAFTVTDIGWQIIIFATWEGCIAGLVRSKYGVIPATLTHGLAIFILSSGLI
ncbi:MAG: CPBP family glutamic-type intramembrane protease [Spirochaetaceae bacterium]